MTGIDFDTLSVLVVDDDSRLRAAVTAILSALGVGWIAEATDGADGLEELRGFSADIVVCDWNMSPMTGIDFLRAVRGGDSPNPDVPFLMLTSSAEMDRVLEARETGATGFLVKPVTPRALSERIASVLSKAGSATAGQVPGEVPGEVNGTATAAAVAAVTVAAVADDDDRYLEFREKVQGTNINEQALLATDYLNHFNEVLMLLDMVAEFPEILERAKRWRPKTYAEHFEDSNLSDKDLIIAAYEHSPSKYRKPFDETVATLNRMVAEGIDEIESALATGEKNLIADVTTTVASGLRATTETANGIIHGTVPTMAQDEIDALFD